jgi:hypothetical protein
MPIFPAQLAGDDEEPEFPSLLVHCTAKSSASAVTEISKGAPKPAFFGRTFDTIAPCAMPRELAR